jgi:hypothetical protein
MTTDVSFRGDGKSTSLIAVIIGGYAAAVALVPMTTGVLLLAAPLLLISIAWWTLVKPRRWITLFFLAALLLPPLPIAFGNSGPHPAILFAALGIFAGLARLAEWRLSADAISALFLIFFCVLLASVPLAALYSGAAIAAGSLARVLLFAVAVYVYFYTAHGPAADRIYRIRSVSLLFYAAVVAALFACFDFYYQLPPPAGYGPQFVWLDSGVFRRAQGLFYEASTLGNFCAFFLVMIAVALPRRQAERPCSRISLLLGAVVLSAALIFSYSRASLLNIAVSLVVLAIVRRARLKRLAIAFAVCICAGASIVYTVFPSFAQSYWIRLTASLQFLWSAPEGVLSGRVASWRTLGEFLMDHPWHAIFGIGYKTLPYSDFVGKTVIADNMYLSLLVETGIVGLSVFLLLNYSMLRGALRASRSPDASASFFGTWIFCFWVGEMVQMLSGDLMTYWRVLPFYFWALGVAIAQSRRVERDSSDPR